MLAIYWNSGESKGYTDLVPSHWFRAEGDWPHLTHAVQGPKGGRKNARCSLHVLENRADLNYTGEHVAYNEPRFYLGTIRLIFTGTDRQDVREVQWRDADGTSFEAVDVDAHQRTMPLEKLQGDPLDLADGLKKIEQMVTLRQGQPGFRNALMDAYERRCAVTGCMIEDVLEAAHILPYAGPHTNHVTNGLLLRADIHTLFDRGLIKIDRAYQITAPEHVRRAYVLPEMIRVPVDPDACPNRDALEAK